MKTFFGLAAVQRALSRFHIGVAVLFFLVGAATIYLLDWATTRPPVRYGSISDVTSVSLSHGAIDLLFNNVEVNRSCPADLSVWLWREQVDPDGVKRPVIYRLDSNSGVLSSLFPGAFHVISTLPRTITPGEYNILAARRDNCSWLRWIDQRPQQTNGGRVLIEESHTPGNPAGLPLAVPLPKTTTVPQDAHNYTPPPP